MSKVSIGVLLPTRENARAGPFEFDPSLQLAREVESPGSDSVWAGDSFVARPRLEPLTLPAAVGAATDHQAVGTAALIAIR